MGDSRLFQEALKRGSAHAWSGRWEQAAQEYKLALKQSPRDSSAKTYLAMALFKSGQLREALDLYQELWDKLPSNLSFLQRLAEVQEAIGDLEPALTSYRLLATTYERLQQPSEAVKGWRKAVALSPLDSDLWDALLKSAVQAGCVAEQIPGYLGLARELAMAGRFPDAIQVVERAQQLDPSSPAIPKLLLAIRKALEFSWKAAAAGESIPEEALVRWFMSVPLDAESAPAKEQTVDRGDDHPSPSDDAGTEDAAMVPEPEEPPTSLAALPYSAVDAQPTGIESEGVNPVEVEPAGVEPVSEPPEAEDETESQEVPVDGERETAAAESSTQEAEPEIQPEETAVELEPLEEPEEGEPAAPPLLETVEAEPEPEPESLQEEALTQVEPEPEHRPEVDSTQTEPETEPEASEYGAEPEVETVEPEVAPPTVEDLLQQAIEARTEGRLEDALSILQGAAEPGTMPAVLLLELASVQAQLGRTDDSIASYTRVLELDPGAVEARLQFARLLRGAGSRDEAERHCFVSLNASKTGDAEAAGKAVSLLLEIVREKAAEGDLPTAVESLLLLRSATACPQQPPLLSERAASASLELLGICGGEHLEELSVLPGEVLAGVVQQLKNAEDLALHGQLRSAADILYELIAENPDFLPAQSLLGRVVAAAGSRDAALNRSDRVAVLYDMRGSPHQGMELYRWRVVDGLADADAQARLLSELKDQNRLDEAEVLQSGCLPGRWKVERATSAFELLPLPEPLEDLLRRAEAAFAGGDSTEAIQLLHSGLEDAPQVDTPTVAALLRMLQVSGESQVDGEQLRGALDEMGLPQGLADW